MSYKFDRMSVLLVEDTMPMQRLMTSVFEALNVGTLHVAEDGDSGFEAYCRFNPDIIVSDWHMLPVSGIEMVRKIRGSLTGPNRMVPLIMMSGYSAIQRVSEARDAGVTEFLVKPFSANDLARRIINVINNPRDFIDSENFFGPDRRRQRQIETYRGPFRRESDRTH